MQRVSFRPRSKEKPLPPRGEAACLMDPGHHRNLHYSSTWRFQVVPNFYVRGARAAPVLL